MTDGRRTGPMRWMKGMMLKHMPLMITCAEFESFILAYLEDELPARERAVFDFHLKICRECRDYLAAYRRTMEVGKKTFEDPAAAVPDAVPEDLIKAVLAARQT